MPRRDTTMESSTILTASEAMVGFEDETERLIEKLVSGPKDLDVISIVGMPGIGKTTLSKKLHSHIDDVIRRFDVRSWCTISQVYDKRKTLLQILGNLVDVSEKTRSNNTDELGVELYRYLQRKRYLIVVDDLWSIQVWDDLKRCFPDNDNGSRIMLTTRLDEVASYAQVYSAPHHLRLFEDEESWILLEKLVFGEESCPPGFDEIGEEIAKSCGGLPLAIALVAGLLAKQDKLEEWYWEEVAQNLNQYTQHECMHIIKLSYKNLPHKLKSCFIYFGAFPEDKKISVRKLIRLWIAEGFVRGNELKFPEEVAKDYLMDLISRNLIMVVRRSSFGKIKAVRIHDLLREFCMLTAKKRNFLQHIDRSRYFSSTHLPSDSKLRLIISSEARSFCSHPDQQIYSLLSYSVPTDNFLKLGVWFDCNSLSQGLFTSLRVLDLGCLRISPIFPDVFQFFIHLRYLALKGYFEKIPSSLSNLKKLETLVLKGLRGGVDISHAMLGMVSLKHVEITNPLAILSFNDQELEMYPPLERLQWLSFALFGGAEDFGSTITKLPNLVKLRCVVSEADNMIRCIRLPGLDSLTQLESLKVVFLSSNSYVDSLDVTFPSNIKKLTLSSCHLPWNEIATIGRLSNLEVLKLESKAFQGNEWEVEDDEFQNLKLLEFNDMEVPKWNFSDISFPSIERVIFRNSRVKMIPSTLGYIYSLQMIEVCWCKCSDSAMESAAKIKETQIEEMGNHEFKLIIKSKEEKITSYSDQEDSKIRSWKYTFCVLLVLLLIISQYCFLT